MDKIPDIRMGCAKVVVISLLILCISLLTVPVVAKHSKHGMSRIRDSSAADSRTFISEIIGFSALKLMLILTIPFLFSIFLGAMLVLLFPFPLITSTTGLAGAAAVGRRQGREEEASTDFDDLLSYLGIKEPGTATSGFMTAGSNQNQMIRVIRPKHNQSNERCAERIACEFGRSASPDFRVAVNQVINEMPPKKQFIWKSTIHAYMEGLQPTVTAATNFHPSQNFCLKYKCRLE